MNTVVEYINILFEIYFYVIIAYVISSFIPNVRGSYIGEMLAKLSEPYLTPFRRLIPPIGGVLDITPIIALIALRFIQSGVLFFVELF